MNKKILISVIPFTFIGIVNAIVYIVLSCLNIVALHIYSYLLLALFLLTVWAPILLERIIKIHFSFPIVIAYEVFLIMAILMGTLWKMYELVPYYDKVVHFASGILFALIIHNVFTNGKRSQLNPIWTFIFVFSFSMMIGALWEIFEFTFDSLLKEDSQKWMGFIGHDVLMDTMLDIICDFFGGIIGGISAMLIEQHKKTIRGVKKNALYNYNFFCDDT